MDPGNLRERDRAGVTAAIFRQGPSAVKLPEENNRGVKRDGGQRGCDLSTRR